MEPIVNDTSRRTNAKCFNSRWKPNKSIRWGSRDGQDNRRRRPPPLPLPAPPLPPPLLVSFSSPSCIRLPSGPIRVRRVIIRYAVVSKHFDRRRFVCSIWFLTRACLGFWIREYYYHCSLLSPQNTRGRFTSRQNEKEIWREEGCARIQQHVTDRQYWIKIIPFVCPSWCHTALITRARIQSVRRGAHHI